MCQSNSLNQRAVVEEGGMGLVRIWVWGQTKDTMQYLYFESEEVSGLCVQRIVIEKTDKARGSVGHLTNTNVHRYMV